MAAHLPPPPRGRTLVIGAGKAGGAMAAAVDALWPSAAPLSGLVVTRYGHVPPAYKQHGGRIEVVEAAHPVPDEAGAQAARRIVELTRGLTADDLVLCLISGGGSALLSMPADGLTFADKQRINRALLESGANITEMNCVRKHLSAIKGGRLAAMCAPARVLTLLISDVPGDEQCPCERPTVPMRALRRRAGRAGALTASTCPRRVAGLRSRCARNTQPVRCLFRRARAAPHCHAAGQPGSRCRRGAHRGRGAAHPERPDRR